MTTIANKNENTKHEDTPDVTNIGSNIGDITDSGVGITQPSNYVPIPRGLVRSSDGLRLSIENFLRKAEIRESGTFNVTDTATTFVTVDVATGLRATFRQNKIGGVLGMRFTTVLTLEVNATRFMQGIYLLCHVPTGGAVQGTASTTNWINMHRFNKVNITQLPHVKLNVSCDSKVTLRIPYKSSTPVWAVHDTANASYGSPGVYFIYPYSPLKAVAGVLTCPFTLWIHYEDVELYGNTVPQSGKVVKRRFRDKDVLSEEQQNERPVSTVLKTIATISDHMSAIPLLSSIAGPVSWVADALSRAAYLHGWSKPNVISGPQRMVKDISAYLGNADAHDVSKPLSLMTNNHVGILPGFSGDNLDEMSIDYIKSISSWFRTENWSTSDIAGSTLYMFNLDPFQFRTVTSDGATNSLVAMTPISFLSSLFVYYRGGFKLKFHLAKTEFHSGRLMVVFTPLETLSTAITDVTYSTSGYSHREIIDIRLGNVFELDIPYVSNVNWHTCGANDYSAIYGSIHIFVLDPLIAPSTVANNIDIMMEISGLPDLQFAIPKNFKYFACAPFSLQSGNLTDICERVNTTIGGTKEDTMDYFDNEACIGEVVQSLRLLLRRGGFMPAGYYTHNTMNTYLPFNWVLPESLNLFPPTNMAYGGTDIFSLCSSIYAIQRGGVRFRFFNFESSQSSNIFAGLWSGGSPFTQVDPWLSSAVTIDDYLKDLWNCSMQYYSTESGNVSFQVPQYHRFPSHCTASNSQCQRAPEPFLSSRISVRVRDSSVTNAALRVYRSGADDCNFGCFVSIPCFYS